MHNLIHLTKTAQWRIFFAEDDLDECALFQEMLKKNGVQTTPVFCHDGEAALDYLRTCELLPDLVFLDINIPRINGLGVLTAMVRDSRLASLPVVVFSTSNSPLSVQQAYALGAGLYAYKPASPATYKALIGKILGRAINGLPPHKPMSEFIIG